MATNDELLRGWPIRVPREVSWGQMDAFGHVNNTVYFRWFEDARLALFQEVGWLSAMEETGVGPILARTQAIFRRPLAWPADLVVAIRIEDVTEDRFTTLYRVVSAGELVAEGDGRVLSYAYREGKKAPIPAPVATALRTLG